VCYLSAAVLTTASGRRSGQPRVGTARGCTPNNLLPTGGVGHSGEPDVGDVWGCFDSAAHSVSVRQSDDGHNQRCRFRLSPRCLSSPVLGRRLDDYEVAPYDDEELARLAAMGITDTEDDLNALVQGPPGSVKLWFQTVPEPKRAKNRVHLDLACGNFDAEHDRLVS